MTIIDPDKLDREILAMREMIDTDPDVRAHFDVNGDGVIDQGEWQAVIQLVTLRLHREAEDAARAQAAMDRDESPAPTTAEIAREPEFEPAQPPREAGQLAEQLFQKEVRPYVATLSTPPGPEIASMFDLRSVVLEWCGASAIDGDYTMGYLAYDHRGAQVGHIARRETRHNQPKVEVQYDVWDAVTETTLSLRQEKRGRHNPLSAHDEEGRQLGHAEWVWTLVGRTTIEVGWDGQTGQAKHHFFDSHTFDVRDSHDEVVARIELGWVGLGGFLTNEQDQLRIEAVNDLSRGAWMAMFASAIAMDWSCEFARSEARSDVADMLFDMFD